MPLLSPFKSTFFSPPRPTSPTVDQCASHVGVIAAPAAFQDLMRAMRAHAAVAATLDSLAPAQRADQLHRAADLIRSALDAYVHAAEDELQRQMVLPFVLRRDSEVSWKDLECLSLQLAQEARDDDGEVDVPMTPKRKETVLHDLDPWLIEKLDKADLWARCGDQFSKTLLRKASL